MVVRLDARRMDSREVVRRLRRPKGFLSREVRSAVRRVVEDVHERGDEALLEYAERFDGVRPDPLRVPPEEIACARDSLPEEIAEAFRASAANVRRFHERELDLSWELKVAGARLGQRVRPLRRAGIYVPGGHGAYPSTLVMTAVPAQVAGVKELCVCTPPGPDGRPNQRMLAVAGLLGVEEVYAAGGAQAVAAMAFGTESIRKVDKIVGPGNDYVTAAKLEVFGEVGIDAPQGPSELLVIADGTARPEWVALDLMAQAEHLSGASSVLLTPNGDLAGRVEPLLSGRPAEHVTLVLVRDLDQAVELANLYAPEHAHLFCAGAEALLERVEAAGLVAVGDTSPVALSDYAAGPSHALPTGGTALWASALGTHDFLVRVNHMRFSREGLDALGPHVERLARLEGFENHARSVRARLE
ncbi:Histidinol dehydrogenase [Rubrobacter xylanophilus DSM 9941]|nr:Histidinol dehydrogenase [Rubrobacter xylanophilus DSM 9941]